MPPPEPAAASRLAQLTAGYTPKQKMLLTILCLVFLPAISAVMTTNPGRADFIVPLAAMLMCIGIPWSIIHFRNQARQLEQQRWQMQMHQLPLGMAAPPAQPYPPNLWQSPLPAPVAQPVQQSYAPQPVYQAPLPARHDKAPNTNPLGAAPGSVVEDETRRLPE
jgi:hypothetical protein